MALLDKTIVLKVDGVMHAKIRAEAKRHKMTMAKLLRSRIEQWPGYNEHAIASLPPLTKRVVTTRANDIDSLLDDDDDDPPK